MGKGAVRGFKKWALARSTDVYRKPQTWQRRIWEVCSATILATFARGIGLVTTDVSREACGSLRPEPELYWTTNAVLDDIDDGEQPECHRGRPSRKCESYEG